jgi:ribosomal protein L22
MSEQDPKDTPEVETDLAEPAATPDAPAADVERTETTDADVVEATDAAEDAPGADEVEEAPRAEAPAAPKPKPAKKPGAAKVAADKPGRKPNGKVARDKHGRPIVDGPVVSAHAKYVRTSARKARLVCDHIRGKSVDEAVAILAHTPRAVAEDWEKLLKSAVANAEHNHELLGDDLKIHAVFADEGPTLKRFRPRAMGRATKIRKRTSHLTIQLTPKES